jgi:hypothetical protein
VAALATGAEASASIEAHGRLWKVAAVTTEAQDISDFTPRFNWARVFRGYDHNGISSPLHYFKLMFPMEALPSILELTNANIAQEPHSDHTKVTKEEFIKYLGIRMNMVLDPIGSYKDYWNVEADQQTFILPRRYGEVMRMTRARFELIERNLQICDVVQVSASRKQVLLY